MRLIDRGRPDWTSAAARPGDIGLADVDVLSPVTVQCRVMCQGANVTTIEGLAATDGTLHVMQEAFREYHALQCGFCTPGMVMSAIDLVNKHPNGITEQQIREGLEGNLCRCTGYHNIVKAIAAAAEVMQGRRREMARAAD